ncbi:MULTISPECIES: hypothetical protein [unclassified Mesorhizobium]|uniref:hypothetical protein n=1 Tax=unclassified Mesorhizobium TaxID=325217 RepID=UPI001CCB4F7B|nr:MULTISPECIES: hypothetical protein [unclassified Mesorhizobium]MBZ9737451.1 hypothetical protein [Mesorhizobium sp. CA9]MBZ9817516.1 hypothetical protein [Mesorhizobium sp. CA7]MBZ9829327.1 hypothetical protein [Mesorhizobium sp. CA18]MBZ9835026.1 hypothetical protein [Mesorhizobium sp. CA2]MBZ9840712.1 hypothetical protein [Mesorhizobium sp. CA3]
MTVDIRWARVDDAEALATLLCAMATHYRQAPLDHSRAAATVRQWLGDESPAYPHSPWLSRMASPPASLRWRLPTQASISKG